VDHPTTTATEDHPTETAGFNNKDEGRATVDGDGAGVRIRIQIVMTIDT
jgi:hypothetical protein